MKLKLYLCILLLIFISILLFFNGSIKEKIVKQLFRQLPQYSCTEGSVCLKCSKNGSSC